MSEAAADRMGLLEAVLTVAAEKFGDLTAPAMERFYAHFPEAKEAFEYHGLGKRERLEAEMIDTALYSVMTWVERPVEVAVMLYGSVPHHRNTLHVRPEWYRGLLNTVIDLMAEAIAPEAAAEHRLLEEIRSGLLGAIAEALASIVPHRAA